VHRAAVRPAAAAAAIPSDAAVCLLGAARSAVDVRLGRHVRRAGVWGGLCGGGALAAPQHRERARGQGGLERVDGGRPLGRQLVRRQPGPIVPVKVGAAEHDCRALLRARARNFQQSQPASCNRHEDTARRRFLCAEEASVSMARPGQSAPLIAKRSGAPPFPPLFAM